MTDYRGFFESQLADIEKRRAALESEHDDLLLVMKRLDAADAAMARKAPSPARPANAVTTLPSAVIDFLKASDQMRTVSEIHAHLSSERNAPRSHLYNALHRLKKRNEVFKADDNMWGLVGRDDKADESSGQDGQSSLITTPSEPWQPPMRSHVSEPS